jgi:hypothetical protein
MVHGGGKRRLVIAYKEAPGMCSRPGLPLSRAPRTVRLGRGLGVGRVLADKPARIRGSSKERGTGKATLHTSSASLASIRIAGTEAWLIAN